MIYKLAQERDIPGVTDLRMEYLNEAYGGLDPQDERRIREANLEYLRQNLNRRCFVAFAEEEGILYSCAYLTIIEKAANGRFMQGRYGDLYGVFTSPAYRRRGAATGLVRLLVEKGRELRLPFVQLEAASSAHRIYQNIGFQDTTSDYVEMKYLYPADNG